MTAAHRRSSVQISIYSRKELNSPDKGVVVQTPCNTNHRCFAKGAKIKLYSETDTAPLLQLSTFLFAVSDYNSVFTRLPPKIQNFHLLTAVFLLSRENSNTERQNLFFFIPFTEKVNGIQRLFLYFGAAAPPRPVQPMRSTWRDCNSKSLFSKKNSQDSMETFVHSCKIKKKNVSVQPSMEQLLRDGPAAHRHCAFIRSVQ